MAAKAANMGPELLRYIEKSLLIQTLDAVWKEHLHALDHLRQGIGLRAYGQRDPLNEYKTEAFSLFNAMLDELKERVTQVLMRVEVVTEPPPLEAPPMEFLASHPAADSPYGGAEGGFDATGLMAADHPVTINAVSGYSGGGKAMINEHDTTHGPAFDPRHAAGDADHQAGGHHAAAFIALLDEVLDHLLRRVEVGDHPIPQGTDGADVAGGAAQHELGLLPDGHGGAPVQVDQSAALRRRPISEGLRVTLMPQASMISSLACAVSAPPEMSAPA